MGERRRQKLVDPFQYKLVARMVLYWAIYQFTLWNFLFCWRLLEEGRGNLFEQYGRFTRENYPMLLVLLVLVPAFAWDAVKFYHTVAGPIYRFRKTMREIASEQPVRPIRLRAGDQLVEMQDDFNAMLQTLARRNGVTLIDPAASAVATPPAAAGPQLAVFTPEMPEGRGHVAT